jgi:hypothetical protein
MLLLLFICLNQEKKSYIEKAMNVKAQVENGKGSDVSPIFSSMPATVLATTT